MTSCDLGTTSSDVTVCHADRARREPLTPPGQTRLSPSRPSSVPGTGHGIAASRFVLATAYLNPFVRLAPKSAKVETFGGPSQPRRP